jgi:hypothetical protein
MDLMIILGMFEIHGFSICLHKNEPVSLQLFVPTLICTYSNV